MLEDRACITCRYWPKERAADSMGKCGKTGQPLLAERLGISELCGKDGKLWEAIERKPPVRKTIKNSVALVICAGFIAACIVGLAMAGEPKSAALWESAIGLWDKSPD